MSYSKAVIDHYENPRNVGKFEDIDDTIGTGMVGAPACFVGNTLIATPTFVAGVTLKQMYDEDMLIPVVSFNTEKNTFEPKLARCVKTGTKPVIRLYMSQGYRPHLTKVNPVGCTIDHLFLVQSKFEYAECGTLVDIPLVSYLYYKDGPRTSNEINFITKIDSVDELNDVEDVYCLQVEENNNFVVLTSGPTSMHVHSGFVVKNCGDVMKLQIKVSDDGIIQEALFKTYGCGSAIASSSLLTEWVRGKTLEEAGQIKNSAIAEELCLPPVKIHCSVLAEDAIKAAIKDYKDKKEIQENVQENITDD